MSTAPSKAWVIRVMVGALILAIGLPGQADQSLGNTRNIPLPSSGNLLFYTDYICFPGDTALTYVEIHYGLVFDQLHFSTGADGTHQATFAVHTLILNPQDETVKEQTIERVVTLPAGEATVTNRPIFVPVGFKLSPGRYRFVSEITDLQGGRSGRWERTFSVPEYSATELALSEIQFASAIRTDLDENPFMKGGRTVVPNPSRTYGARQPILYFYMEIHNLVQGDTGVDSTYTIDYRIAGLDGRLIKSLPAATKRKPGRATAEIGGINIVSLTPGVYTLALHVRDNASGIEKTAQGAFVVVRREAVVAARDTIITEEQAKRYYDQIAYIATPQELKMYQALDLKNKMNFLREFWKRRDPTPDTEKNEAMIEHYRRWVFVNRRYAGSLEGWRTDMGRIYLKYGPPDKVERHLGNLQTKSYEIWYYYSKDMDYIFADLQGIDTFTLIHSRTPNRDEIEDPDWERRISAVPALDKRVQRQP